MQRVARGFVTQERPAVFGGEDQMNVNGGKGLWHGRKMTARMSFANPKGDATARTIVQSQRDCVLQPKVARNELPWEKCREKNYILNEVVADIARPADENGMTATALRLEWWVGR